MRKLIWILLFLLILAGIWGFLIEPNMIQIEKIELKIRNLPPLFKGIKIVQLSDFHSKNFGRKEKKVLEILNELQPDFVFITGDFIGWSTWDLNSCQAFWKELSKNYQGLQPTHHPPTSGPLIFGVYGNHEHRSFKFKVLDKFFKESQIEILNNKSTKLNIDGEFIYLIGVDDPHLGYDDITKAMEDLENEAPKILIAHSPEIFRKVKNRNIDLVLTGHTHGNQINLPILGKFLLPLKYDKKYQSGLFNENSTYLYINRGVGTTVLPLRFNSPPEITLITLTRH